MRSKEGREAALPATTPVDELKNRHRVVILQHPQEPDVELGSALLAARALQNSTLRIGLSWRSVAAALEEKILDPKRWGVLYLGPKPTWKDSRVLVPVSRKGLPLDQPLRLDGVVVLDGTWSQVKALWWRNPWLLKLQRLILQPPKRSRYGNLRKEPRHDSISTIEAIALVLQELGENPKIPESLNGSFEALLAAYKASKQKNTTNPKA